MAPPTIKFKKLHPNAIVPQYQTAGAAGMDLVWGDELLPWCLMFPGEVMLFATGLSVEIPQGYEGQIRARSSLAKRGLIVPNAPGTVDSDYRGPLSFLLMNVGKDPQKVESNVRLVQLVIAPVARCQIQVVEELSETVRGSGAFGSTGR